MRNIWIYRRLVLYSNANCTNDTWMMNIYNIYTGFNWEFPWTIHSTFCCCNNGCLSNPSRIVSLPNIRIPQSWDRIHLHPPKKHMAVTLQPQTVTQMGNKDKYICACGYPKERATTITTTTNMWLSSTWPPVHILHQREGVNNVVAAVQYRKRI